MEGVSAVESPPGDLPRVEGIVSGGMSRVNDGGTAITDRGFVRDGFGGNACKMWG